MHSRLPRGVRPRLEGKPRPGDRPDPGIEPRSPALQADALPSETPGKKAIRQIQIEGHSTKQLARILHHCPRFTNGINKAEDSEQLAGDEGGLEKPVSFPGPSLGSFPPEGITINILVFLKLHRLEI